MDRLYLMCSCAVSGNAILTLKDHSLQAWQRLDTWLMNDEWMVEWFQTLLLLSLCIQSDAKTRLHIDMQWCCCCCCIRDAAWELENNAFTDLLERHSFCDVTHCRCPHGRSANLLDTLVIVISFAFFSAFAAPLGLCVIAWQSKQLICWIVVHDQFQDIWKHVCLQNMSGHFEHFCEQTLANNLHFHVFLVKVASVHREAVVLCLQPVSVHLVVVLLYQSLASAAD